MECFWFITFPRTRGNVQWWHHKLNEIISWNLSGVLNVCECVLMRRGGEGEKEALLYEKKVQPRGKRFHRTASLFYAEEDNNSWNLLYYIH